HRPPALRSVVPTGPIADGQSFLLARCQRWLKNTLSSPSIPSISSPAFSAHHQTKAGRKRTRHRHNRKQAAFQSSVGCVRYDAPFCTDFRSSISQQEKKPWRCRKWRRWNLPSRAFRKRILQLR
ncbi:unnamed protein product, partial [Ectocarpus sp. 13 AM-2016]